MQIFLVFFAFILSGFLPIQNFATGTPIHKCTEEQIEECAKPHNCPFMPSNITCTYTDYLAEHCSCCKKCPYPPPKSTSCPRPKATKCSKVIHKCTPDQFIEEMCKICRHCDYQTVPPTQPTDLGCPTQSAPICNTTVADCSLLFCPAIIKLNCTYDDYKAEYCGCCKKCVYPPPRKPTGCPATCLNTPTACAQYLLLNCTKQQYINELCDSCQHCPYQAPITMAQVAITPTITCPTTECGKFCPDIVKLNCTYADYKGEYCACCKECIYPPPESPPGCPTTSVLPPCALFIRQNCTQQQYIDDICGPCHHCLYPTVN